MKFRRPRAAATVLGALLATAVVGQDPLGAQTRQRAIYVSVLDRKGAPVADLTPADVEVREDNVAREVLRVARATEPMQIAILVDNSQAATSFIRDYREALPPFVEALLTGDSSTSNQVALIALAERPTIVTDYTVSRTALAKGIGRVFALSDSGAYLLDGLIEVSRGIRQREAERSVIVVITSEGPELSGRTYPAVLEPLWASGATMHVLTLGLARNASHDRSVVLSQGSKDTGGRYETVLTGSALLNRLRDVAAEITSQYVVTYGRTDSLIPPERVTVKATRPGLVARARRSADRPSSAERGQDRP